MRWSINKIVIITLLGLFLFGLVGIYTITYEKNLNVALKEKATKSYLDQKILFAIHNDEYDDAVMYQQLAEYLGVNLSKHTLEEIESHSGILSASWRNTKDFGTGFFTGESDSIAGISGAIAADMTIVGDLRDLSIEGSKFVNNESYDKVILGMSTIGVGLSASQFFTIGATTPLKISASIIKIAKKMKYLSNSFVDTIVSKLSKAIDFNKLKKVNFSSISSVQKATKTISKSLNSKFIRKAFKNIDTIKSNTSVADTLSLLKYVDNPKDLQKMANISKKYKTNTKAVFKILGKSAIRGIVKGSAKIIKWTKLLVAQLISLFVSVLSILLFMGKGVGWLTETISMWFIIIWRIWKKVLNFIWELLYNSVKHF